MSSVSNASRTTPPALPHNYDAEQAWLGALLANNAVWFEGCDIVKPEHYYDPLHGRIHEAIGKLIDRGEIANPVTLKRMFDQDGALKEVGGAKYLVELAQSVVTVINASDYARAVQQAWLRRRAIEIARIMTEDAMVEDIDRRSELVIEDAEMMLAALSAAASNSRRGTISIGEASAETLQRIESAMKTGYSGLSTGFINLNKITTGLHKTDLIIVAGATSMGKTTLALNIADNVGRLVRAGIAAEQPAEGEVLYASLEMSADQLVEKFLSARTDVSTHRMRTGALDMETFGRLVEAHQDLIDLPFKVDDTIRSVPQLRSAARRMKRGRGGLSLIVVDYLQLMESAGDAPRDNRVAQVSAISRGLKLLAMELQVPLIAISQLSRKLEDREDKRPILADLRESGAIEQDADIVLFAYREEYYLRRVEPRQRDNEADENFEKRHDKWARRVENVRNIAEVICAKNRHGPLKTTKLYFNGAASLFRDLATDDA